MSYTKLPHECHEAGPHGLDCNLECQCNASMTTQNSGIQEDDLMDQITPKTSLHSLFCRAVLFIVLTSIFLILGFLSISNRASPTTLVETDIKNSKMNCGLSPAEALQNGCIFDLMSFSWLPPSCHDEELAQMFEEYQEWQWYTDWQGENSVEKEIVRQGTMDNLYVSWQYHLVHCTYMWKKMHRAILSHNPIDAYAGSYHHTQHCEDKLLDRSEKHSMNYNGTFDPTRITISYPSCGLE